MYNIDIHCRDRCSLNDGGKATDQDKLDVCFDQPFKQSA